MCDPLGTISAVLGLADVALRTSTKLYTILSDLHHVPKEVETLTNSLWTWKSISQNVKSVALQYQSSPFTTEDGLGLGGLLEALRSSEGAFSEIELLVKAHKSSRSSAPFRVTSDARWLFDCTKVQTALTRLDRSKQTLTAALAAIGRQNDVALRNQMGASRMEVGDLQRTFKSEVGKWGQILESGHSELTSSVTLMQITQRSLDTRLRRLHKSAVRNYSSTQHLISSGNRSTHDRLAALEAKVASLAIVEDRKTNSCSISADGDLGHILIPLTLMHSYLRPFILDLIRLKKVSVNKEDLNNIYIQLDELLASCHDISAYRLRDNAGAKTRNQNLQPSRPSWYKEGRDLEPLDGHRKEFIAGNRQGQRKPIRRSGVWTKKLPLGVLKIQLDTLGSQDVDDASSGLCAHFVFLPDLKLEMKCVSASFRSGIDAAMSPKTFHHFRAYNWILGGTAGQKILDEDNSLALQGCLARGTMTPWDRYSNNGSGFEMSVLAYAAYRTKPKCFKLLLEQGALVYNPSERNPLILAYLYVDAGSEIPGKHEKKQHILDLALNYGADYDDMGEVFHFNKYYTTPLHAIACDPSIPPWPELSNGISHVVSKGFDINTRDHNRMTAFLCGLYEEGPSSWWITVWIEAGSDPHVSDLRGRNVLHLLACGVNSWELGVASPQINELKTSICILLKTGCNPNQVDICGRSVSSYWRHFCSSRVWEQWLSALNESNLLNTTNLGEATHEISCPFGEPIMEGCEHSHWFNNQHCLNCHGVRCKSCSGLFHNGTPYSYYGPGSDACETSPGDVQEIHDPDDQEEDDTQITEEVLSEIDEDSDTSSEGGVAL